jgi:hypothetical protein
MGKQNRKPFGVGTHSSKEFLEYVHSDMWSPSPVASLSGKWYYVSFIDDYSRFTWIYSFIEKICVLETFKGWRAQVKIQMENKVKALNIRVRYLRSDNGNEHTSKEFERYCKDGILRHLIIVCTPQQNTMAEPLNQTVLKKVKSMLSQSGLSHEFWAEVVNTAVYLINLPPSKAINFLTSFEMRHKRVADYHRLKVFDCDAFSFTPKETRSKLEPTSKKCCFLGYASGVKGYKQWDPVAKKMIINRNVSFN